MISDEDTETLGGGTIRWEGPKQQVGGAATSRWEGLQQQLAVSSGHSINANDHTQSEAAGSVSELCWGHACTCVHVRVRDDTTKNRQGSAHMRFYHRMFCSISSTSGDVWIILLMWTFEL